MIFNKREKEGYRARKSPSSDSGANPRSRADRGPPRRTPEPRTVADLPNDAMSALFQAVVEATEEAIYNSLFMATTVTSRGGTVEAIPLGRVREILAKHGVAPPGR